MGKRLIPAFLAGLILFQTLGLATFYLALEIRHEWKFSRTPENELSLTYIYIPHTEAQSLQWDGAREFWYQGNLYDIISQSNDEGGILYKASRDDKEQDLHHAAAKAHKRQNRKALVLQWGTFVTFSEKNTDIRFQSPQSAATLHPEELTARNCKGYLSELFAPPEL